jgi:hypothetical protein
MPDAARTVLQKRRQKVPKLGGRYKLAAVAAIMPDHLSFAAISS